MRWFHHSRTFNELSASARRMVAEPSRAPASLAPDTLTPGVLHAPDTPTRQQSIVREGSARSAALARARAAKLVNELEDNNFIRVRRNSNEDIDEGLSTDLSPLPRTPSQSEIMMNSDVLRRQMDWLNDSATQATKADETQLVEALAELKQAPPVKKNRFSPDKTAKAEQLREDTLRQIVAQLSDTREAIASLEREAKQMSARRTDAKVRAAQAMERAAVAKERAAAAKARVVAARASVAATKGGAAPEGRAAAAMESAAVRNLTAAAGLEPEAEVTSAQDKGLAKFMQRASEHQVSWEHVCDDQHEPESLAQQASPPVSPHTVIREARLRSPTLVDRAGPDPDALPSWPVRPSLPTRSPATSARRGWWAVVAMCVAIVALLVPGAHLAWAPNKASASSIRAAPRGLAVAQRLRATYSAFRVVQPPPEDQITRPRRRRRQHPLKLLSRLFRRLRITRI